MACPECNDTGEVVTIGPEGDEGPHEPCECVVGVNLALARAEKEAGGLAPITA